MNPDSAREALEAREPDNSKLKTQTSKFAEQAAVLLLFIALTVALTWPAVTLLGQGINAFGDVVLQMTTMTWDAHALMIDPLHIAEAPFFYPYAHSNAYSEHLIGETLVALPLFWLAGGDPAPAHNFNFLLSFVLTGYFTYLLTRDLTGSRVAAVAAGIAYAFTGYRFVQSGHLNILATEWFPFTLWALRRGLNRNSGGYLALAAAGFVLMGLFSVYFLYFLALLVALYVAWWLLSRLAPQGRRQGEREEDEPGASRLPLKCLLAALGALVVLLPVYIPYIQVNSELGLARSVYEVQTWTARVGYFANVLPTNWFWANVLPDMISNRGERQMFPGLIITALAVLGLLFGGRRLRLHFRGERWFYVLLAAFSVLLTFGMDVRLPGLNFDLPLPYAWLYNWVPGFTALRVPVRFVVLLDLALAVLGGYGAAWLLAVGRRPARLLMPALLVLMTLEYVQVRDLSNHRDMRPPDPQPYTWLASHPGPVVDLPMSDSNFGNVWATYWATYHWQPLVSGAGSFMPPGTVEIAHALAGFPDPQSIALLQGLEIRHVVVHLSQYKTADRSAMSAKLAALPTLHKVFTAGDAEVYELSPDRWAARVAAALPAGGTLWIRRGSANSPPPLDALAYALDYSRLPDAPLPTGAAVTGDLQIGNRPLPPLPFGHPADLTMLPASDSGVLPGGATPFYSNPLTALWPRDPGLLLSYDLTALNSPYAPRGLELTEAGTRFQPPGAAAPEARREDLLIAAFGSSRLNLDGQHISLVPGLNLYSALVSGPGLGLPLSATGKGGSPLLLRVDVRAGTDTGGTTTTLTDSLVLDLGQSSVDHAAAAMTTSWRIVPKHPGGAPFTLTLDVYQKPAGTHPDGHLGSWSLPVPAGADGHSYTISLNPLTKTATATLDGTATPVYAWQGPPRGGDFSATLNLLSGEGLLKRLPVYDFTLEDGRITDFSPSPGAVVVLPFAGR